MSKNKTRINQIERCDIYLNKQLEIILSNRKKILDKIVVNFFRLFQFSSPQVNRN